MKVILTPWKTRLLTRFSEAKRIELVCPFIKLGIVRGIVASVRPGAHISLVTRAKPGDFAAGASDIDALRTLFAAAETLEVGFSLAVNNTVHAKIFIFDDVVCYVGSSNLTASGLERSLEGTVEMTEAKTVLEWRGVFQTMQRKATLLTLPDLDEISQKTRKYLLTHKTIKADEGLYYDTKPTDNVDVLEEIYRQVESTELPFLSALQERVDDVVDQQLDSGQPGPMVRADEASNSPPDLSQEDIVADERSAAPVSRYLSERKIEAIQEFVALAQNSFDLPVWSDGISVAHSIIHPSVFDLLSDVKVEGRSLSIGRQIHSSLRQLGYDSFSLGLAILCLRSGLLTRYGPAFCSTLESAIRGNGFLQKTWQRRFLPDPIMNDTDEANMTVGSRTMKRLREDEAYRLFAFASVSLSFDNLIAFLEENWNPLVEYGSSVVEFAVGKDPKTRLQEIATQSKLTHHYGAYTKSGSEHEPYWTCELDLGGQTRVVGEGNSKKSAEMEAALKLEHALRNDARWQAATRTHRKQTFRNYVELGPWPVASKLDLDPGTRSILIGYIQENSFQLDAPQLYGCLINTHIRHDQRIHFNNASLAYLGSFAMRWIVSDSIVRDGSDVDHASLANGFFARMGGVSGLRELYQKLGWGRYANDNVIAEALQSLLASLVLFSTAEDAKAFTYKLMDRIPESSLVEFVPDGRLQSKLDIVVAGVGIYDPKGDYITLLQEFVQHFDKAPPAYENIRAGGPDHAPLFIATVSWRGFDGKSRVAPSAKAARREAAHSLLSKLKGYALNSQDAARVESAE